ncbi:hypothetical protein RND71_039923 [Anisodus tanguticus]|uniref:Uncharacterized protein n=1 Tax=Anisodus tanguticus TaxID=243964 RepID=A0AAE1USF4_9SOLA|nr:hypothetical protein RND71_039923 [Anisodus tanguticus]
MEDTDSNNKYAKLKIARNQQMRREEKGMRIEERLNWSQSNDNSASRYEEASQVPGCFGSQTFTSMLQEASMSSRHVCNKDLDLEVTLGSYGPPEENNANSNGNFVPPVESPKFNNSRAGYARGRMPTLHHSSSSSRREVVEQEDRQQNRDYPWSIRPISNRLYDPSFAVNGQPVDPHLRMLKENPNFCNPKAGSKGKVVIDLKSSINNNSLYNSSSNPKAGSKGKVVMDWNK